MRKVIQRLSEREKQLLESARPMSYREVEGGDDLSIHFYFPKQLDEDASRPALLFFNDGAWDRGNVIQFAPHALYYVGRGAVCGLVEYRNRASHPDSTPLAALQDGGAAVRFVRHYAGKLNVDPAKIVTVGAGAGGNIAACAAMKAHAPSAEGDFHLSSPQPAAAVLFSAIYDPSEGGYGADQFADAAEARGASLPRYVASGLPAMLIFHGTADRIVPFAEAAEFAAKMKRKKNDCELIDFEGRDRNFFNLNVDPASYEAVLGHVNEFLDRHGILAGSGEEDDESQLLSWRERDY